MEEQEPKVPQGHGADDAEIGEPTAGVPHVESWLASVDPRGSAGDACQRGRCELSFDRDGCGGMHEGHLS